MQQEIEKSLEVLKKGGIILYPTDTIWGIGCDATNQRAVDKVYKLKRRIEGKSLLVLVDSVEMIKTYVNDVNPLIVELVANYDRPLTVIYPGAKNVAKGVAAGDKTIGIRVVHDKFCNALIQKFGKAIVSTSANLSGEPAPIHFNQISDTLKQGVDYVVDLYHTRVRNMKASRIIRVKGNGDFEIVRP
jgi:L-threonylcarbamoyladenylate synthase